MTTSAHLLCLRSHVLLAPGGLLHSLDLLLQAQLHPVVLQVPLPEGRGIHLDDGALHQRVGSYLQPATSQSAAGKDGLEQSDGQMQGLLIRCERACMSASQEAAHRPVSLPRTPAGVGGDRENEGVKARCPIAGNHLASPMSQTAVSQQ